MTSDMAEQKPMIKQKSRISSIWILPIIALIIGIGMLYQEWSDRGQQISITFENAEGLEIKKTRVKYKNVNIGILDSIDFSEDGEGILAMVTIERDMTRFLRSDSQFWVVRPRIGSSGISGIGTLLSGAYINLEPGKAQELSNDFKGLEAPPVASPNDEGLKLKLVSSGGKALSEGNPVMYRGFEVGAVEAVNFDVESREVSYDIFIQAPYHHLITTNTYFWNVGGFELSTNGQGLSVDFASVETFVSGGVEFDIPEDLPLGDRITESTVYELYANKTSATEDRAYEYLEYVILVEDSIAGIKIGTPVEYRGIRIGRVAKPYLGFHQTNLIAPDEERIPVIIHIEPRRLTQDSGYSLEWFDRQFKQWIETGLAATVETANFFTGAMKVSLDMSNDVTNEIAFFGDYMVIPIGASGFDSILEKTDDLLSKLNALDVESMINNFNTAVATADKTLNSANDTVIATRSVIDSLNTTLAEGQAVLKGLQPNSPLYQELQGNLIELQTTLDRLQPFLEQISAQPNLLIFSDQPEPDPQPKRKNP